MSYYSDDAITLHHGDSLAVLRTLPDASVDCCVTSPPYFGLRDYGVDGQIGSEASTYDYAMRLRKLFAEVRRVLADDGTLWLNLGDSYGRGKQLMGAPWRVANLLQDDGWNLRNSIIWHKPNAMPESVTDRMSTRHENLFMFSKTRDYWFDLDPIREPAAESSVERAAYANAKQRSGAGPAVPGESRREFQAWSPVALLTKGKNPGDVWTIPTSPFPGAHFATMPPALAERCVVAGCKPGGVVLDPFSGSGTTGLAATRNGRRYVGIDLNADYLDLSLRTRLAQSALLDDQEATG